MPHCHEGLKEKKIQTLLMGENQIHTHTCAHTKKDNQTKPGANLIYQLFHK